MGLAFWDDAQNQSLADSELTDLEKQLRDLFVREYLYDYDSVAAAQRCGFSSVHAIQYSQQFLSESYVRIKIKQALENPELQAEKDKNLIFNTLRKVMHIGTCGDKVRAATQMAALLGIGVANKQPGAHSGGVMIAPGIAQSLDSWESYAMPMQDETINNAAQ